MSRRPRPQRLTRRPTVTVVIPCYNYGHYLPTAVASVLKQPAVDVDVIVIDDASPDGSAAVVRELAAADERVRSILHSQNRGHIATYNEGLEQASGEYVVLLSADDALTPGALERATALLDAHPSVGFVYGFPKEYEGEPPPVSGRVRSWTVWSGAEWIERRCRTARNCILSPEVVMRTTVQHAIGGFDPGLPHAGDLDMWLRAAAVSDVGRVNGPAQAYYRVHHNNMHLTHYSGLVVDLEGRRATFEKALAGPGARVAPRDELFAAARRALAITALDLARSAYDHGRAEVEPVDEYVEFAARVWPAARRTRAWRTIEAQADGGRPRPDLGVGLMTRRVAEGVRDRVRWRRWRWHGV